MQKLIIIFHYTDGCTYDSEIVIPFEYESLEKAKEDLFFAWCEYEKILQDAFTNRQIQDKKLNLFYLNGLEIDFNDFTSFNNSAKRTTKFIFEEPDADIAFVVKRAP